MAEIWVTSDWHFNHDKEFIWKPRGFSCIEEMNEALVERHNSLVKPDDIVYVLGDLMLGPDNKKSIELIKSMNGYKIIIGGNHDTVTRRAMYVSSLGLDRIYDALTIKAEGHHFFLSHYPTLTANLEKEHLKQCTINLFGHTHQDKNFFEDKPFMYHVGVDSHNCYPVNLQEAIKEMYAKVEECKSFL